MTSPTESDRPGGDLTDHGADPEERQASGGGAGTADAPEPDAPGGALTDHGADPVAREEDRAG
jgi:hypothetical protein